MQISKLKRKSKCCATMECDNLAEFRLSFDKVSVPVCSECACKLYNSLGGYFIPRSIKNKFNLD